MTDDSIIGPTSAPSILVAEQETISRSSLSELLRNEGYRVIEAVDSGAALHQLSRQQDIQFILADLEMPSWSSIVKFARTHLPRCFVLGMVRYGALANASEAQQLGAHGHLIKPLSFNDIIRWIKRCRTGQSEINR